MSDPFLDLADLLDHVWMRLGRAVADRSDPMRLVVLATSGPDGADARTVALRRADRAAGEIEVHSDRRTAKIGALEADPRGAILLWDPEVQLQIRLKADFEIIHADPLRWDRVPQSARANYGTDPAPGTPLREPGSVRRTPDRSRFAALIGRIRGIDVVSLAHIPHRRAQFDGPEGPGLWVAP
ncbi:MAG: pyridoxamine 5'-phosphate oxidase family protein [Pseudomonadota bacterium]